MKRMGVGIIGCGAISEVYLKNLSATFGNTSVVAVTDRVPERAQAAAKAYGVPRACDSAEALLGLAEVELALILTQPDSHAALARAALEAGKHVYVEKPYACVREDAAGLLELAKARGLRFSSAPDTLLGAVVQTGRKLLDEGWIGEVIGASMSSSFGAPEAWHPNPDFLYRAGAGPLYDNGPYAVGALAYLLGPVGGVACAARRTYDFRVIGSGPRRGEQIAVEVPTFLQGVLSFQSGASATVLFSCDTCNEKLQETGLEIYGSEGTLVLSHPSRYGGTIQLKRKGMQEWAQLPLLYPYTDNCRGIGVADMAAAIRSDREARLSGELIYHCLDVLFSLDEAGQTKRYIPVCSAFRRTRPLPTGLALGEVE